MLAWLLLNITRSQQSIGYMPVSAASSSHLIERISGSAKPHGQRVAPQRSAILDAEFSQLMGDITAQLALEQDAGTQINASNSYTKPESHPETGGTSEDQSSATNSELPLENPAEVVADQKQIPIASAALSTQDRSAPSLPPSSDQPELAAEQKVDHSEDLVDPQATLTPTDLHLATSSSATAMPADQPAPSDAVETVIPQLLQRTAGEVFAEVAESEAPTSTLPSTAEAQPNLVAMPSIQSTDEQLLPNMAPAPIVDAQRETPTQVKLGSSDELALMMQSVLQSKLNEGSESLVAVGSTLQNAQAQLAVTAVKAASPELSDLLLAQLSNGALTAGLMNAPTSSDRLQGMIARTLNSQSSTQAQSISSMQNESRSSTTARSSAENARQPRTVLTNAVAARTIERIESALKELAQSRDGKTISLRLDPPQLGAVKIDVSLRDGALHARVVAESPAVNALLRERSAELQATLRKLGLDVERITVATQGDVGQQTTFNGELNHHEQRRTTTPRMAFPESAVAHNAPAAITTSNKLDHWVA